MISVLLWPWLRDESPNLARIAPADFIRKWVEGITNPDTSAAYNAYMALQIFFKGVNVVGVCFAAMFGALLIARERENHTLEFLMSRPVSRSRLLLTRFAVMVAALVVPIFLTSWSAIPLSWTIEESLALGEITLASAYSALFCVMILALTTICSVRFRTQLHVVALVGSIAVFQVCIYFVQEVRVVSLFRVSDYEVYAPILAGNLPVGKLFTTRGVWLLLVTVAAYLFADRQFKKAEL